MKVGDIIEASIWVNGEESKEQRASYESDVTNAIIGLCDDEGFLCGDVSFAEKCPEDDRVPDVPNHIRGIRVRLLVAEATIVAEKIKINEGSFISNLDYDDLKRIRSITREATSKTLTDQQVDELIEEAGPEAVLDTLRKSKLH